MASLEDLLHEAECLERGSKGDSVSTIGLGQMSIFYNRISHDYPQSLDGRLLLAQQGIDAAKTESLIKEMQTVKKPEESISFLADQKRRQQKFAPLRAIEQFDRFKQQEIESNRGDMINQMLQYFNSNKIAQKPVDPEFRLFPSESSKIERLSEYAQAFASCQADPLIVAFESLENILQQSVNALKQISNNQDKTYNMRIDFFNALQSILCRKELADKDLSNANESAEILREMVRGSLDFLSDQFRRINFPRDIDTTIEDIDSYVLAKYPNVQPPWPHIWIALRAGFIPQARQLCEKYAKETREFTAYFNRIIVDEIEPTNEIRSRVIIDSHPQTDFECFKMLCYTYVVGLEMQQPPMAVIKKAEDFIFSMIAPLRFNNSNIGSYGDYGTLNEIQSLVEDEAAKIFSEGNYRFVYSMLMAIVLKFDTCANTLLKNRIFPIDVVHILIILKKSGLWNEPGLPSVINEFIKLLPHSMAPQIVDYLSFAGDQKYLIDFLLSLDIKRCSVNLETQSKAVAAQLVRDSINANPYSLQSLHLLVICLDYVNACKIFMSMSSDVAAFSLPDSSRAILICSILISRLKGIDYDTSEINGLQNSGVKICLQVLSRSDDLTQSERVTLLDNVKIFLSECVTDELTDMKLINAISLVSHCLNLLVLFDSGRSDLAIAQSLQKPHIIPFDETEINDLVNLMNDNLLPSATIVSATTVRFIAYYLDNVQKNKDKIRVLFNFCSRIQSFSEETNKKLMELHDQFASFI